MQGGAHVHSIEVEYNQKIDDMIALLTVQNPQIDFDRVDLFFNGHKMRREGNIQ
jgi:hypothetical protein